MRVGVSTILLWRWPLTMRGVGLQVGRAGCGLMFVTESGNDVGDQRLLFSGGESIYYL